jgi:hypothetical protein
MRTSVAALNLVWCTLLVGCAGPYGQFYHEQLGGQPVTSFRHFEIAQGDPTVIETDNMDRDAHSMLENGFVMIGYSSFNAGPVPVDGAKAQARKVGAAAVLVQSRYTNTVSGSMPMVVQNPDQTVTTYLQGNVYGRGGYASYSGTSTSTVPGGYTTYQIPYSVQRFDYLATYWVHTKPPILGVMGVDLPDDIRRQLQTNHGVLITAVRKNSPAFEADLLKGDVIRTIDGEAVSDQKGFLALLEKDAGKRVVLGIVRGSQPKDVSLTLNRPTY